MFKKIVIVLLFMFGTVMSSYAAELVSFKGTTKVASGDLVILTGKLTKPQGDGPFPAIVLLHTCAGFVENDDDWSERLVTWGYVSLEVDSLKPRGRSEVCSNPMGVPINIRAEDAYDAKSYLGGLPFVDRDRIAVIGWSHGGCATIAAVSKSNYATWAALATLNIEPPKREDVFRAAIAFYPLCIGQLDDSNTPLLILAGELDNVGPAALCQMKMPSGKTANEVILKIYPGAYHCFDWEGANPKALADSIVQVKEFLANHLK